jgi:hypothetical protein
MLVAVLVAFGAVGHGAAFFRTLAGITGFGWD